MIDFGNFYREIATGRLSHWLDVLPAQLSEWKKNIYTVNLNRGKKYWKIYRRSLPLHWI